MESTKQCNVCLAHKPLTEFHTSKLSKDGKDTRCKPCKKDIGRKKLDSIESEFGVRMFASQCVKIYGCTLEEYRDRMQGKTHCESCGKEDRLVYDHDHITMEFRGALCSNCNAGFGLIGDSLESVEALLNYARRHYA